MITIKNLQVKVAGKVKETDDISTFELVPETGASLPSFEAGAHVDMHVPGGIIRQYSLCNDPKETHHYDDGAKEQLLDIPGLLSTPKPGVHLYVCGPKGFMDAVLSTAREAAWPEEQLHYEFFSADVGPSDSDSDFVVEIASTGKLIPIPKEKTIIEVLEAEGIDIPMSCEQGVCGTCLTRVIEGIPDHKDLYLTPQEQDANDQFLPCCSRAKSDKLVLDL